MTAPVPDLANANLPRRLASEFLGTAFLLAVIVGSGIMGERLAGGNVAIALLANTLATGAGLVVLVIVFGPISGAHMNPIVTLVFWLRHELDWKAVLGYLPTQILGAIAGVYVAHLMFAEPVFQLSAKLRDGPGQALSEAVATFGLIGVILGARRFKPDAVAAVVGLYIGAAYWFTASMSFANPAVTIARSLSDTFAGVAPGSVPAFVLAQFAGGSIAAALFGWLLPTAGMSSE